MAEEVRRDVKVPMVFMTYANVIYSYGAEKFAERAAAVGMDGVILPDLPFEEKEEFAAVFAAKNMDLISLVAPTSAERIAMIAKEARGFLYVVSSLGVTGVRSEITTDIGELTRKVRQHAAVPCAIGFGISTPEQAGQMAQYADGVIVGSAIIKIIAKYGKEAPPHVGEYVKSMCAALKF